MRENDLEILEVWLDGELPDEQADELRRRLGNEPELSAALDQLRGERQIRSQYWPTLESGDAEIEALLANVRRSVQKDKIWSLRLGSLRRVSGIAAMIAVVFMAGWVSHTRLRVVGSDEISPMPQSVSQPLAINSPNNNQIQFQPGKINFVGAPIAPSQPDIRSANYQLQIRDQQGRLIAVQPLQKLDDPQKFMANMGRFESQRRSSDPILVDHQQP